MFRALFALSFAVACVALAAPLHAERTPPATALPLSQILLIVERQGNVAHFTEVEWDRGGYWDIEYVTRDGKRVKAKVDPVSGDTRR